MGKVSGVITGTQGLYLAQVAEITPSTQQSFGEAREDVKQAAIRAHKETPEYVKQVNDYVGKIIAQAKSIEDMKTLFPDLQVEVKQSDSFGLNDMLFNQGILMDGRTLLSRVVNKKPGDFVGPIYDLLHVPNFVEVVERVAPEGETWEKQYATEKAKLHTDLIRNRRQQNQQDYLLYLQNKFSKDALVQQDNEAINKILGLDKIADNEAPANATTTPAAAAASDVATPVLATPAETPAPETPPADSPAPAKP